MVYRNFERWKIPAKLFEYALRDQLPKASQLPTTVLAMREKAIAEDEEIKTLNWLRHLHEVWRRGTAGCDGIHR